MVQSVDGPLRVELAQTKHIWTNITIMQCSEFQELTTECFLKWMPFQNTYGFAHEMDILLLWNYHDLHVTWHLRDSMPPQHPPWDDCARLFFPLKSGKADGFQRSANSQRAWLTICFGRVDMDKAEFTIREICGDGCRSIRCTPGVRRLGSPTTMAVGTWPLCMLTSRPRTSEREALLCRNPTQKVTPKWSHIVEP